MTLSHVCVCFSNPSAEGRGRGGVGHWLHPRKYTPHHAQECRLGEPTYPFPLAMTSSASPSARKIVHSLCAFAPIRV